MDTLSFRHARVEDAELLATLNAQLIRDEGHRNSMSVPQLTERMATWLRGDHSAVIFESDSHVVGYALYRTEPDYTYLRHLFVVPAFRQRGIGRRALTWLWQNAWTGAPRVRIDVLVGNVGAMAFWRAVGFHDYCTTMESEAPSDRRPRTAADDHGRAPPAGACGRAHTYFIPRLGKYDAH